MAEFETTPQPLDIPTSDSNGLNSKNVKELKIGDGSVYIRDGAIYITDETGLDRIVIGYLKNSF